MITFTPLADIPDNILLSDSFSQASKTWACFVFFSLIVALQSRAILGYEEDFPLPARCFCLRDGSANLVEGEWTDSRGNENRIEHPRDDFLDQLTLCCLIKPGKPVAKEEHFQDAAACQNEAWVGSYTDRLASEGTIDQHSALLAQRL